MDTLQKYASLDRTFENQEKKDENLKPDSNPYLAEMPLDFEDIMEDLLARRKEQLQLDDFLEHIQIQFVDTG